MATTAVPVQAVPGHPKEDYTFYNTKLREDSYDTGDIYNLDKVALAQAEWEISSHDRPYLKHVKDLSVQWPHLRLLADFMEISTTPVRWKNFRNKEDGSAKRDARAERTNVARLDYMHSGKVLPPEYYDTSEKLRNALREEGGNESPQGKNVGQENEREKPQREVSWQESDEKQETNDGGQLNGGAEHLKGSQETNVGSVGETPTEQEAKPTEQTNEEDHVKLRLFVVEDLSRDVIEALGAHLDIEPAFFREQIVDYAWYNTRDRWMDPPSMHLVARRQHWMQLRFPTVRYFKSKEDFKEGRSKAELFNVLRRPDDDQNNKALWDEEDAIVGIMRTRSSFWLRKAEKEGDRAVGVLLLDPTIPIGTPLWYGYRNWEPTPGLKPTPSSGAQSNPESLPKRKSFFDDFVYWAQRPDSATALSSAATNANANIHIPVQALLHLVASEWLTISEYIRTRLGQIEWEISYPEHFLHRGSDIDVALKKLHVWRRLVPLYREMLTETLQRVFQFPCHPAALLGGSVLSPSNGGVAPTAGILNIAPPAPAPTVTHHPSPSAPAGPIAAFRTDFLTPLAHMEEYQQRIDRLTTVVTAIITIADSRRGLNENRNLARLTWLATFYIPLSFVASLFSMQSDLSMQADTFKIYFASALPLAALSLGLAVVLTLPSVHKFGIKLNEGFQGWWRKGFGKKAKKK